MNKTLRNFSSLFDNIHFIIVLNELGEVSFSNNKINEALFHGESIEGHPLKSYISSDSWNGLLASLSENVEVGGSFEIELKWEMLDQVSIWTSFTFVVEQGVLGGMEFVGLGINITSYKNELLEQARFKKVLGRSNDIVLISLASNGKIVDANETAFRKLLYKKEELEQCVVTDIEVDTACETESDWIEHVETIKANSQNPLVLEGRLQTKTGQKFLVHSSVAYEEFAGVGYLISISRDVSELVRFMNAVKEAQASMDQAQEFAGFGTWEISLKDEHIIWSRQVFNSFGMTYLLDKEPENVAAFRQLIHPEDRQPLSNAIQYILQNTESYELEIRQWQKNTGEYKWFLVKAFVKCNEEGVPYKLVGVNLDIHNLKQARTKAKEEERRLKAISNSLPPDTSIVQMVWYPNEMFGFTYASRSVERVLGFTPNEMMTLPKKLRASIHPDDLSFVDEEVVNSCTYLEELELEVRFYKGGDPNKMIWIYVKSLPFVSHGGEVHFNGVIIDITDRKNEEEILKQLLDKEKALNAELAIREEELTTSEEELKQTNQVLQENFDELSKVNTELDRFVYSVSHDLRAPITSILGLINLTKYSKSLEEVMVYLDMQRNSVQKLDRFIKEILEYSRNARMKVEPTEIDFHKLIGEVYDQYLFMDHASEIERDIKIESVAPFYSDHGRLVMIFNNLISNALRYQDPEKQEKKVKISVQVKMRTVHITIKDNGIGIAEEFLDKIFDMFFRATEAKTGSGLGLYIVNEAVNKLGGQISVKSKLGVGSEFNVEIPNLDHTV